MIGLGYVGLPVAVAFAKAGFDTLGFDIDPTRVAEIKAGRDRTGEVPEGDLPGLRASADPADLRGRDFYIVTVPTPITAARTPDLGALESASRLVGAALSPGAIVVFESTVYPGATEEVCAPILESVSGLVSGRISPWATRPNGSIRVTGHTGSTA